MSESLMVVVKGVRYRREDAERLGLLVDAPNDDRVESPADDAQADKPAAKKAATKKKAAANKARKAVSNKSTSGNGD